jgi:hypothetical protein
MNLAQVLTEAQRQALAAEKDELGRPIGALEVFLARIEATR